MNAVRHLVRIAVAALLVSAGVLHIVNPDLFLAQVPTFLPLRTMIVYVSGLIEVCLGIGLLIPRTAPLAGRAAAVFFLAIFPGNIWQAVAQVDAFGLDTDISRIVRLAFQPVLIVAVLFGTGQTVRRTRRRTDV